MGDIMILNDLIHIKEQELAARKKTVLRCCLAAGWARPLVKWST